MDIFYRKVAVSERLPKAKEMLMTSHGWSLWNGHQFEDEDDKPISYINYWFESVPDPTDQLKADKAELLVGGFLFKRIQTFLFSPFCINKRKMWKIISYFKKKPLITGGFLDNLIFLVKH